MIIRQATMAMGTRFELVLAGEDEWALRSAGDAAIEEIESLHDRLSLFRPDSLVSHINRTAPERPVRIERPVFDMLATAKRVWEQSEGAFDVTMGAAKRGGPARASAWGMDALVLDEHTLSVSFSRPGPVLDLGGIAKGFALDAATELLRQAGVRTALLHAGTSSVAALGAPDDQPDGWRISLGPAGSGAPVVVLRDASLSVSAHHPHAAEEHGAAGHVLDPRSGASAEGNSPARLAACIGVTGVEAEAWSTALLVLGRRPPAMPPECVSVLQLVGVGEDGWRAEGDPALVGRCVKM